MISRNDDLAGQKFGALTVEELLGRDPAGERSWLCRCECGGERVRTTRQLTHAVKRGWTLRCQACRIGHPTAASSDAGRRRVYRNLWRDHRRLWSDGAIAQLAASVHAALVAEYGPGDRYDGHVTCEDAWAPPEVCADPGSRRDDGSHTLEEIAGVLSVTRERVRQIEASALRKFARRLYAECPDLFGNRPPDVSRIETSAKAKRTVAAARKERARLASPVQDTTRVTDGMSKEAA